MATTLYLLDTVADTHLGTNNSTLIGGNTGWNPFALATTQGAGVVSSSDTPTVAGPTPGVEIKVTNINAEWLSPPVSADVTISGTITANIWASEDAMNANVAINVVIDIVRATDNSIVEIVRSTRTTEVAVTSTAVNNFTTGMTSGGYTSKTLNRGDRLRIRVFGGDAGTMGSGFSFNIAYAGTTAAANGDTFVTFTENFSFESAPSGSVVYLTNAQSGLSAAPALISAFTGSDENPLSEGGNWANLNSSGNALQRISNAVSGSAAGDCHSYWTPANFGADLEAYFTVSTLANISGIVFRVQGEGGAGTWDGYRVFVSDPTWKIQRVTNATATDLISVTSTTAVGDKIGVRIEGSTIQLWRQASGGSWNLLATAVDTTYASAGKVGIYCNATSVRVDDFYAATDSNLFTQQAWTSRGAGVVSYLSDTDAGWVAPLLTNEWFTPQLTAFTLTGMAQANIRALESSTNADASLCMEIARVDSDGTNPTVWSTWCIAPTGADGGELTISEVARTCNLSGGDLAVTNGQRLRIRLYLDDISTGAMVNAFNVQNFYNGTSAAASGDTYITFPATLTEFVEAVSSLPLLPTNMLGWLSRGG